MEQLCEWRFLVFRGCFEMLVTVTEDPSSHTVDFSLVESKFMRDFMGRWQVRPVSKRACEVTYTLEVQPSLAPPPPFASYTSKIFVKQAEKVLEDLAQAALAPEQQGIEAAAAAKCDEATQVV